MNGIHAGTTGATTTGTIHRVKTNSLNTILNSTIHTARDLPGKKPHPFGQSNPEPLAKRIRLTETSVLPSPMAVNTSPIDYTNPILPSSAPTIATSHTLAQPAIQSFSPLDLSHTDGLLPSAHCQTEQASPLAFQPSYLDPSWFEVEEGEDDLPAQSHFWSFGFTAPRKEESLMASVLRLDRWPYIPCQERQQIQRMRHLSRYSASLLSSHPVAWHVDFTLAEIAWLLNNLRFLSREHGAPIEPGSDLRVLSRYIREGKWRAEVASSFVKHPLHFRRTMDDLSGFLSDLSQRDFLTGFSRPEVLTVEPLPVPASKEKQDKIQKVGLGVTARESHPRHTQRQLASLRLAREIYGARRNNLRLGSRSVAKDLCNCVEDAVQLRQSWAGCAGDITAISWVSPDHFLCGTTVHSDAHNHQYNKPGNLLLGSTRTAQLQSFADHRIVRPRTFTTYRGHEEETPETLDPWLYCSVVSSSYEKASGLAFTSSFDQSVKVWKVDTVRDSMQCVATWEHKGNVNFVCASTHPAGFIATGTDVARNAIRVYYLDRNNPGQSRYVALDNRLGLEPLLADDPNPPWAYFPATMQWGRTPACEHLLLVGFSPRSCLWSGSDADIPEEKQNTGVAVLWDVISGQSMVIGGGLSQNVFEVAWHPSQETFIVATTSSTKTATNNAPLNIRLYSRTGRTREYTLKQVLDCYSTDINELTIQPTSLEYNYITAGTTDGKVYVWDTAQGDRPMHILQHGPPIEELLGERDKEDSGVKFTAWGKTLDRFYSGSSDGVVKVWNVRDRENPFVCDLVEVCGPISFGSFSDDKSKLVIGDASGRVHLLSIDNRDIRQTPHIVTIPTPQGPRKVQRPYMISLHAPPSPPHLNVGGATATHETKVVPSECEGRERGAWLLATQQLILNSDPTVGVSQGPQYERLQLWRRDAHVDEDPRRQLKMDFARHQQERVKPPVSLMRSFRRIPKRRPAKLATTELTRQWHTANQATVLDVGHDPNLDRAEPLLELTDGRVQQNVGGQVDPMTVNADHEYIDLTEVSRGPSIGSSSTLANTPKLPTAFPYQVRRFPLSLSRSGDRVVLPSDCIMS